MGVFMFLTPAQAQKKSLWERLKTYLDSSNVRSVDPAYIRQPDKPWSIVLYSNTEQLDLKASSTITNENLGITDIESQMTFNLQVKPPASTSVGLWAGYRGNGVGYSLALSGNKGYNLSFGMVSPNYGLNVLIRRFSFNKPKSSYSLSLNSGERVEETLTDNFLNRFLSSPMKIGAVVVDGYWIFNKKRFSLTAAYDQSTTQLRSAGSLIAGVMYYYQKFDYNSPKNFFFIRSSNDVGLMKTYQGSLGLGYTYNWVPARGWVVNVVVMPVLTLFNQVKSSTYEIIYPENKDLIKTDIDEYVNSIRMRHTGDSRLNDGVRVNLDLRMAVSYCWRNWYVGITGKANRFRSNNDNTTVTLTNWNVKASLGHRL
jgi:hypothetical protein